MTPSASSSGSPPQQPKAPIDPPESTESAKSVEPAKSAKETDLAQPAQPAQPPEADPTTHPQTLGGLLRAARLRAGLSLEEAAHILRLRPAVIRELEGDDLRSFDHASYARMTLLGYARILRLPEEEIRPWLPQNTGFETSEFTYLQQLANPEAVLSSSGPNYKNNPRGEHSSGHPLRSTLKVFLALVLLLGIGYGYLLWRNLSRLQSTAPASPATTTAVLPTPTPPLLDTLENIRPAASPSPMWPNDPLDLNLQTPTPDPAAAEAPSAVDLFRDDDTALNLPPALPVLPALPVDSSDSADSAENLIEASTENPPPAEETPAASTEPSPAP